jgi:hypothetical protein
VLKEGLGGGSELSTMKAVIIISVSEFEFHEK